MQVFTIKNEMETEIISDLLHFIKKSYNLQSQHVRKKIQQDNVF